MRIARITKIKKYRVFRDFLWPNDLPAFAQFNIIYGWNGTGKTALSSLFTHLQYGRTITQGEVEFELNSGAKISGADISNATILSVRVFNRDFVAKTIDSIDQRNVTPIYYLGSDSIEQQQQVKTLKAEIEAAREAMYKADTDKQRAERALDDFSVDKAKLIKEALLGSAKHASYNKRDFKQAVTQLMCASPQPMVLSDEQKESLRKQKERQAKSSISPVSTTIPDITKLRSQTSMLLERSIASQVIDDLTKDSAVGVWVQQGLSLHTGERETNICRFCGNKLSPHRRAELEAHFSDAFATFQLDIEQAISNIDRQQQALAGVTLPDESRFYDHLSGDVQSVVATAKQAIQSDDHILGRFKTALERKKATPFEVVALEDAAAAWDTGGSSLQTAIDAVNAVIAKHETTTKYLNDEIKQACQMLEKNYVLESLPKFDELNNLVTDAKAALSAATQKPAELTNQINTIESEIIEHRRPAEELNRELRAYLGRDPEFDTFW